MVQSPSLVKPLIITATGGNLLSSHCDMFVDENLVTKYWDDFQVAKVNSSIPKKDQTVKSEAKIVAIVLSYCEGIHYTKHLQVLWALISQVQFLSHSADLRAFAMC